MNKFKNAVEGEYIRGTKNFKLTKPLTYGDITVPVGFVTNFASIPRALNWYINTSDPIIRDIAVVHDFLYVTKWLGKFTRKQADQILYEGMLELGASKAKAKLAYTAVRIGGYYHWGHSIV
jgi:hypothetical protein